MQKRNITLSLPVDLIRQAKVYAATHDTTINRLVSDLLMETVARDKQAQAGAKRLLELAKAGPYFTGDLRKISRDEIHERR